MKNRPDRSWLAIPVALLAFVLSGAGLLPRPEEVVKLGPLTLNAPPQVGHAVMLQIDAQVLPGWHINSNLPLNPDYIGTEISVIPPPAVAIGMVKYPPAETITPSFAGGEKLSVFTGDLKFSLPLTASAGFGATSPLPIAVTLEYQACNDSQCLRPTRVSTNTDLGAIAIAPEAVDSAAGAASGLDEAPPDLFESHGYVLGFLLVLLGGLALNLTPCVYPLIGVTLAYFGNQGGGTRRVAVLAGLYVLGIALMFSAVGVAVALSGGLFGAALQNPLVLAAIALLLIGLAGSSFGLYTFQMPHWMLQRAGNARPGYIGAVVMGLGMGVVAAPCIGPVVVGLLLVVERSQNALFGFGLFFTLALGMGLPYVALALLAGSIRSLPRSGEWLAWVEQLFGFVLIGLAFYFLDPIFPGRIITRLLPFYAAAVGIYLGFISKAGRSWPAFRAVRVVVGTLSAVGLLYLAAMIPRYPAAGLSFSPYRAGLLESAKKDGKPVLIDFAADWCIPCREMESTTYTDPEVLHGATRFVRLKADLTAQDQRSQELIEKYGIQGVPTTVFIDSSGQLRKRIVGYIGSAELLRTMRAID